MGIRLVSDIDAALVAIDEVLVALAVGNDSVLAILVQTLDDMQVIIKQAVVDLGGHIESLKML